MTLTSTPRSNPFEDQPGNDLAIVKSAASSVMRSYSVNGRLFTPKINVAWQLTETKAGDGGFVVLAGSHRANVALPSNTLDDPTMFEHATHVQMAAGDVLFFMGGAVCHGALPWVGKQARGAAILQYHAPPVPAPRL